MAYSEKEICIFNGVRKLLCSGENLHTLKAQDIADAAGVGKGTIYDYFASKDEIIAKAIVYAVSLELQTLKEQLKKVKNFKEQWFSLLDLMIDGMKAKYSTFYLLFTNIRMTDFCQCDPELLKYANSLIEEIQETLIQILLVGVREGCIVQKEKEYMEQVVVSALVGFGKTIFQNYRLETDYKIDQAKLCSFDILLKTLN